VFVPALEVAGEHHGVGLTVLLEPVAGEAVAEMLVVVAQGGMGAPADQRVPERELPLPGHGRHSRGELHAHGTRVGSAGSV
jgi:hypothetical protein